MLDYFLCEVMKYENVLRLKLAHSDTKKCSVAPLVTTESFSKRSIIVFSTLKNTLGEHLIQN